MGHWCTVYTAEMTVVYRPWHCVLTAVPAQHHWNTWTLICRAVDCERASNRSRFRPILLPSPCCCVGYVTSHTPTIFTSWIETRTDTAWRDVCPADVSSLLRELMQVLVEIEVLATGRLGIGLWAGTTWVAVGESWFLGRDERAAVTR